LLERLPKRIGGWRKHRGLRNALKGALDGCRVDHGAIAVDRGKLEHISELSDVARPSVRSQALDRLRLEATLADRRFHLAKEMLRQEGDVVGTKP